MKPAFRKTLRRFALKTLLAGGALGGAFAAGWFWPRDTRPTFLITAYCNCEKCCEWTRDAAGEPVFASGPLKGKRKQLGITASGKTASQGTAAARRGRFPYGTLVHIEGAGVFRIEDTGALRSDQIDIWFPTHDEARQWGRQFRRVQVLN